VEGAVDALGRQLLQIRKTILAGSCTPNHDCKGMEAVIYLPVDPNLACRRGGGQWKGSGCIGKATLAKQHGNHAKIHRIMTAEAVIYLPIDPILACRSLTVFAGTPGRFREGQWGIYQHRPADNACRLLP
jgi:hypothetical protein